MKAILALGVAACFIGAGAAQAAPHRYVFEGVLTSAGQIDPIPQWQFAPGQTFRGTFVYDPDAITNSTDYISNPDWTLTYHTSPILSFSFTIGLPGSDYSYSVPLTSPGGPMTTVDVGQGTGGWTGAEFRMSNYPVGGVPTVPVPASALVGAYYPHSAFMSLVNSPYANPSSASLLPNTSPDIDFAALWAGLIGPERQNQFSVRFSDPTSWSVGRENLQAALTGRIDSLSAVPEPRSWALMIAGFALAGGLMRRARQRPTMAQR